MFQFKVPDKIMMGDNIVASVENVFNLYGKHALIVTGPNIARSTMIASLERTLDNDRVKYTVMTNIEGEPTVKMIEEGVEIYRENGCDFIIGLGGDGTDEQKVGVGQFCQCLQQDQLVFLIVDA